MPSGTRLLAAVLLCLSSSAALGGINLGMRERVSVKSIRVVDNGDNDGFADPHETVSLYVTLRNSGGIDRHGIVIRVASTDPTVACIPTPILAFGSLLAGEVREAATPLVLRMAGVARNDPFQDLSLALDFTISGDDFDRTRYPQKWALDVDLNASGGFLPSTFTEGFESAGFGSFTTMSLDVGREESNAASDGYRCQYNDPDFSGSNSYGSTFCFLGAATAVQNAYDWHVHDVASPDGGRAYLGNNALHWGVHAGAAGQDTTRLRQLDAIRTLNPINLGWNGVTPELTFKHQVGLLDGNYLSAPDQGEPVDRGIVQLQLANSAGQAVGSWRKISPHENVYNGPGYDRYTNCTFDPTDDGNTEDDRFGPSVDPYGRHGPSSTCRPEFAFSRIGGIGFDHVFDPDVWAASDGPGLQGVRGPGTWVESKFSLDRYRGRRVRLRFLATSFEISNYVTVQQAIGWNPVEADDGWYVDDVRLTGALTSAATISVDSADRSALPACGPVCTSVTASLVAPAIVTCGDAFLVDASGSTADQCPGGVLQFRFWANREVQSENPLTELNAELIRDWSENAALPEVIQEPFSPRRFGVDVRCSTRPACQASATVQVGVDFEPIPFPSTLRFDSATVLSWGAHAYVDVLRGDLLALRAGGGDFNGTVEPCLRNDFLGSSLSNIAAPLPGEAKYFLVRADNCCAGCSADSYSTTAAAEMPGAGGDRDDDIALDPDHCLDPWE